MFWSSSGSWLLFVSSPASLPSLFPLYLHAIPPVPHFPQILRPAPSLQLTVRIFISSLCLFDFMALIFAAHLFAFTPECVPCGTPHFLFTTVFTIPMFSFRARNPFTAGLNGR